MNSKGVDFNIQLDIDKKVQIFKQPTKGQLFQVKQYRLAQDILDNYQLQPLVINNQDRPEYIQHRLYGSVEYFWLVLMCNDIIDPYYEWIMPQEQLYKYCKQKYRNFPEKEHTIYYHKNEKDERYYNLTEYPKDSKLWYDKLDKLHLDLQYKGDLVPITYLEHEIELNEEKRIVQVLDPSDFNDFIHNLILEGVLNDTSQ